jgi:hypothetical protein
MEMIDRDYGPELTRIEMFARPPFDRRGWWFWGDALPGRAHARAVRGGRLYSPQVATHRAFGAGRSCIFGHTIERDAGQFAR